MFKVGDIVRRNIEGKKIYHHKMYDQTFKVLWVSKDKHTIKVSGFKPKFEICFPSGLMITDLDYTRNKKINKILNERQNV